MKIQIINGPNLNMLGIREPEIYGTLTLNEINRRIEEHAKPLGIELSFFQSNHEGAIIDKIQECFGQANGIIINPGAYTHYSIAIRDALAAVGIPTVEVHLSDINSREDFRKISVIKNVCVKQIWGKGVHSYLEALEYLSK
ncbi:type II 3-dehydroquinate dehydratase [Sinanaerobacter chloroacetimidivorans]|uniref:3-dehydroquinate dehydratase n=1 Tax=Sinanaerobacter chloroacetimidivorans TaxID=2818044 RepID=A0A8J8B1G1_9FIRM|nr:type II 3-dehydroquinate dehydratase [Sinanaerobacter chloroacetimidivorans]MBR0597697.1 type II 3-dehydroquinate dehydratase [Sinanaerobacter chloroacetimidivorans]